MILNINIKPYNIKVTDNDNLLIHLLYLSLDTEMNARISQVYEYLYDSRETNPDKLLDILKRHENWNIVMMLSEFNYKKFVDDVIDDIGLLGLIGLTNDLTDRFLELHLNKEVKLLNFLNKVYNYDDLIILYSKFTEYFKNKCEKHILKYEYLIKEVIEDLNGNRPFNEDYRIKKRMGF
jgi:hypothetical protein